MATLISPQLSTFQLDRKNLLTHMLELDQDTEKRSQELLKKRAKQACIEYLNFYMACMQLDGVLGVIKCRSHLKNLNNCLGLQYVIFW
jgi:hypothetical protein